MKKILTILFALISLASCERYVAPDTTARRTVLVYMEARNNLNSSSDIEEMTRAAIPADCHLLVYYSSSNTAPRLMEIRKGKEITLKSYPAEASAIAPKQMAAVIADARTLAPAKELGVVMWSHSAGWTQTNDMPLRGFGYENYARQMSVTEMATGMSGQNIDFIFFDSCYMGCVEVAYELRHCARYLVASVCEVPGPGMNYEYTIPALMRTDMVGGLKEAIDITVDGYRATPSERCPSTLSLIDLGKMDALAAEVRTHQKQLPEDYQAQRFSCDRPYKYLFFDLGQYLDAIGGSINDAVLHNRHTSRIWGEIPLEHVSGLSIYLPELTQGLDYDTYGYSTLQWYNFIHKQI